jgi:hypothetical protein
MAPLHPQAVSDHTWYYCPTCDCQWIVDRTTYRMHAVDAAFGALWVVVMVAALFGIIFLVMRDGQIRYGHDYLNNGHLMAALGVGCLCWAVLVPIGARVYSALLTGLTMTARLVWDAVRPVAATR